MKKIICFVSCICICICMVACHQVDNIDSPPSTETPTPTDQIEMFALPLEFHNKESFQNEVLAAHEKYNTIGQVSEHGLEKIKYYYDFTATPQESVLDKVTVAENCNYISLMYQLEDSSFTLTWYRADFGDGYDHFESSKAATSGMPQQALVFNGRHILEVYHRASDDNTLEHYSYHWQQDSDYIDMIVPANLVESFGAESFLSVDKTYIEFGDISPAVVVTPTFMPSTPTPSPVPDAGPTMSSL